MIVRRARRKSGGYVVASPRRQSVLEHCSRSDRRLRTPPPPINDLRGLKGDRHALPNQNQRQVLLH
jgi:hypothetical protein